ncbi:MAG: polysaccharide deacetylase family protein [Candidatus Zixiibacteriota bacterium]
MGKLKLLFQAVVLYCSGLWLLFRRANKRKLLILMYHGIVEKDINVWTQVPVAEFDRQMAWLKKNYTVVPLEDAIDMLRGNKPMPDYTAAITFDDGFLNNKTIAYPILKKYNLPATIFLSTSLIDDTNDLDGLLWPDFVTCLIRMTKTDKLDMQDIGLSEYTLDSPAARDAATNTIVEQFKKESNDEKIRKIKFIKELAGIDCLDADSTCYKGMSWDDVIELDKEGLISFGAHTISHPILSRISEDDIRREIVESKNIISQKLGKEIKTFAYPNGNPEDYNEYARKIAQQNFICTLTTEEALNAIGDDVYSLRRVGPGNKTTLLQFKLLVSRAITVWMRLIGR